MDHIYIVTNIQACARKKILPPLANLSEGGSPITALVTSAKIFKDFCEDKMQVLNQLGNATSDPTSFKIPQVPNSVLAVLGLYRQSFKILNAVEPSV